MSSERDLKGPNFSGTAAGAAGAAGMVAAARGQKRWFRWLMWSLAAVTLLVVGAGAIDKLTNINTLPKCDAQRTRDTLSDLNKKNQVNASAYNFIRQRSASDTEILCTANLALRAGGTLEYDYRIYKDGGGIKVEITEMRR